MRRILVMLALIFTLAGCDALNEKKEGGLTTKQRAAWQEKRKEVADHPYMVVGYDADENSWMTCVFTDPKLVRYDWKKLSVDLWHKDERDSARELAKQKADSSSIATTVLIDLVGEEDPKAVRWFYKTGDVLKSANGAPRPDLAVSLKQYMLFIQSNPQMVKIPEQ
jgi:hypothetical protein